MKNFYVFLLLFLYTSVFSQEQAQLAEPFFKGNEAVTARSMGLAGAFGSIGADLSSATHNPAGIAFFRKKEIGLGLGYNQQNNDISFLSNATETEDNTLQLNNIGFVYSNLQTEWINDSLAVKRSGLVSWSLTAGMNQKSVLNEVINYEGYNMSNSLLTSYVQTANQFASSGPDNLDIFEQQANDVGLLEFNESGGVYNYFSEIENGNVLQTGNVHREGARRDFYLGGGMNYSNKFYVGATIGIPWMKYSYRDSYIEEDAQSNYSEFNNLQFSDEDEFNGIGAYLGVGAIYRFNDYFRAGLNVKSPTVVELTRESTIATMADYSNSPVRQSEQSYESTFNLTLPWKGGLQLVGSHPQYGLISLEGEFVDYQSTRIKYSDENGDFSENDEQFKESVQNFYGGAFNFRGGIEARIIRDLRLRAGYSHQASPYKNEDDELGADYSQSTFGLGLGYRFVPANIAIDLGYNHITSGEYDNDYIVGNQANSIIKDQISHRFKLSVSKRFNN